ncbi:isopentenyldiphosphate isomerase [Kushneria sinocarnis]|uniref:Isopentenyldiphosphate isomerase n=1 Tax=Kushneria sinocarnis TaxID=595502 RepID=A0A420X0A7_9GAMM|nr:NUDIX domain-containing protein [Kushneria sinocarnis]RKR06885.1 isopentenyldiphosphate isomerase [Kushneria sinocarnis]
MEQVQLVDRHNRPRGSAPRSVMRRLALWHRASYIFVFDAAGRLCVQRRTSTKDIFPSGLDLAAGGVVAAGEAMHVGARRELFEELGIRRVPLHWCFNFTHVSPGLHLHGGVYRVRHDGPVTCQPSEVEAVEWWRPEHALAQEDVTPDTRAALAQLLEAGLAPEPT